MIVESTSIDLQLVLLAHYVRVVVLVLLFADRAVGVLLVRLRKHYLTRLFNCLSHLLIVLYQLLLFVSLESPPVNAQDERACKILTIKVEHGEGVLWLSGFPVVFGAKSSDSIILGVNWIIDGEFVVFAACIAPSFGFFHFGNAHNW